MGKVSIGLRGWRFDEDAVFDADGQVRPLDEMDAETRQRVLRLSAIMGEPCDACYLIHGDEGAHKCNTVRAVYGEPGGEVLLCDAHEPDFVYWFREADGRRFAGQTELRDRFHAWFDDGGRAPEGYEGVEHVERDPEGTPDPADPTEELPGIEDEVDRLDDEDLDDVDVDLGDLEF